LPRFVSSTTDDFVASSSILSMVEPRRAIVRIKVEKSTMTMFNERFTRKRPKSPNYIQSLAKGYIFLPVPPTGIYIYVVYDVLARLRRLAVPKTLTNDTTETEALLIRSCMLFCSHSHNGETRGKEKAIGILKIMNNCP
jgi:hypothetical protein